MTDGAFIHAFSPSNLPIALAENEMGIHPAALDLRQGVEGVPQVIETLHAFHQLLRGGLMYTGGKLDPIVTVEGIIRLIVADTLGISYPARTAFFCSSAFMRPISLILPLMVLMALS